MASEGLDERLRSTDPNAGDNNNGDNRNSLCGGYGDDISVPVYASVKGVSADKTSLRFQERLSDKNG